MLHFINVSKVYKSANKESFYALKDFTFNFNKKGLYCILGKSGSGKSTIANLGAMLDIPSSGEIIYNGQDISKFHAKQINNYRSRIVTIVFQHYNLLPDLSVIDNIIVPRLALQEDERIARKDARDLLKKLGFADNFAEKPCKNLSGGEMQRVAILRAIINNPEILIADEPTGALDEANAKIIMQILKVLSKKKIVIMITHNTQLALEYGDEIINLKDGKLDSIEVRSKRKETPEIKIKPSLKLGRHNKWINRFAHKRLKTNRSKNILSCLSMVVGLVSVFLIFGFSNGSQQAIQYKCLQRFDYGTATICKNEVIDLPDSMLDLTKMTRLNKEEIKQVKRLYPGLEIGLNFDSLFSNSIIKINGKEINKISLKFIYDFNDEFVDRNLLYKGDIAKSNGIIINRQAEELISKENNFASLIGREVNISTRYESINKINNKDITDEFHLKKNFKIYGCSEEFAFLATPKIFVSYKYIKSLIEMEIMPNFSKESGYEMNWHDYILNANDNDEITSFSHKIFFPRSEYKSYENIMDNCTKNGINIESNSILLKDTFAQLMDGVKMGLYIFSSLSLLGTMLIIGINAFSSFAFERKRSAIYFAFGVSKGQVFSIYILESLIITLIAFMLSVISSFGLQLLINFIIMDSFSIPNIVSIPFSSFKGIPLFLIFAGLIFALVICIFFTWLPLVCSKKINLKKELSDE